MDWVSLPQYAKTIFILFQRLHKGKEFQGTGMGLSLCKKTAENHGGFIMATAFPNGGSTFAVYFPAEYDRTLM